MEVELFSLIVPLALFAFTLTFVLHTLFAKTNKPRPNLPPGPWKFPFIGNLHLFINSNPPHQTFRHLAKKYGPIMHLQLGEIPTVVVSSPETAKEILKTHDINFASRPSLMFTEISCYGNTDIAFSPFGEYWRQLRKICTLELLSATRVQSFRPIREEEFTNLCKWMALNEGLAINLSEKVITVNYDITMRAALGTKTCEHPELVSAVQEGIKFLSVFHIDDLFPSVKVLGLITGMKKRIQGFHQKSDRILNNIIDQRKRHKANKVDDGEKNEDLLDVLLKVQDSDLECPLTTDNIKAVLTDVFAAGIESSATIIDWAMAEMLKNPTILRKAQDEVRGLFDNKDGVDESCFEKLKYLKSLVKETLRLHQPGPMLLPRETTKSCKINGYDIPKITQVLVNAWAIGRDPEYWEDAESYKPERFLRKTIDYRANSYEYIPFGGGRRFCPGMSFGLANIELPLAMFLYHFDWVLPNGMKPENLDMAETTGLTAQKKNNLWVIPILRRPLKDKH